MPFVPLKAKRQTEDEPRGFIPLQVEEGSAQAENPAAKTVRAIANVYPVAETAANLATQAVALPAAGLAGLGSIATNAVGLTDTDPADVVHGVGGALTYQPQTELGQHLTGAAMYPFEKLAEGGQAAGGKTLEVTGSPVAATAVDTAINALPMVIAPGVKLAKGRKHNAEAPVQETVAATPAEARPGFTPIEGARNGPAVAQEARVPPEPMRTDASATAALEKVPESKPDSPVEVSAKPIERTESTIPRSLKITIEKTVDGKTIRKLVSARNADFAANRRVSELEKLDFAEGAAIPKPYLKDFTAEVNLHEMRGMNSADARSAAAKSMLDEALDEQLMVRELIHEANGGTVKVRSVEAKRSDAPTVVMSAPDSIAEQRGMVEGQSQMNTAGGVDAIQIPQPARNIFGRDPAGYTDAELLTLRDNATSNSYRADFDAEISRRNGTTQAPETLNSRAEPETLNSWAPGMNYVPLVDDAKMPASTVKTVADLPTPLRRENIIKDFAQGIGTSVYEGRVKGNKRLGFFRTGNEEVRIKRANDIEVAAHEVAHLIDSRVPEIANAWRSDKALRAELKSVSYDQMSVQEGFAEGMRLFLTQPEALQAKAPKVHAWLDGFASTHEYGPALRKAQTDMTAWYGQDALNRARSKIGTEKPLSDHFDGFWDRFRQATVDDLHGVYKMERDLTGKIKPNGPYESARLSRASASISDGAIRYGAPVKKVDGSFTFKGKGLEEIMKPVADKMDDALLYFVGRSARELHTQGREHLFTPGEIDAMLRLRTPERDKAFSEYQDFNKGVLDFAEAQGVINSQARSMWQRTQYLPFHRVGQADGFKGAKPGDWSGIKALTGGTENIKDVLGNMVQNAAQLIDKAVKNEARVKIADLADKTKGGRFMVKIDAEARKVKVDPVQATDAILKAMGINRAEWNARGQALPKHVQRLIKDLEDSPGMMEFMIGNQPPAGSNVVAVLRNGKPDWYEVGDPILYRALSSIDRKNQHWLINWLGLPKRVGQATITMTPEFWVANMARDTIMGSVMTRSGFKPVIDSLRGMRSRMLSDPVYKEYIANGGGLSSIYLDETKLRAKMEKFYGRQGIDYRTVLDTPEKLLGFVETLGDAFEMSTRLGEFKKAIAAGEHPRHAAYQGREVSTDFAMRGDSQALGMMYDTVIFLKPAVLSWDRLARGLTHDTNRGAIAIKAGALAMSSAALYLLNRDDPRYKDLPDWDRDANWHFFVGDQHFRYPKVWEIGALSSAAERTAERILDKNPENLAKDFTRILGATFNLNLMPQIMAPVYEQATNRNRFTKAPIETPGMENMQPFLRAKPGTSETMKALGMATADLPESMQVNPARAEALLRGYFNTWAMYGLMLSDQALFSDQLPTKRADELPVVRRFYSQEPARHTKYEEQFYDLLEESKRLHSTMRELDRIGRPDMADEKEKLPLSGEAKPLERAAKNLQTINAEMRLVRRGDMTPEEKRARLDELTIERNALIKASVQDSEKAIKPYHKE